MKKALFILLLGALASCGKAPEMKEAKRKPSRELLQGKSHDEVVELKYNKPFELRCSVRNLKGEIISLNTDPVDQFNWILDGQNKIMRVLHYKVGTTEMIIVVKILAAPVIHPYVTHKTEDWKEYYMENTPVLKIKYRRAPKKILLDGSVHDSNAYSNVTLYENIEKRIFTITSEVGNTLETDDFRCKLVTSINPKFSDQWKQVK